MRDSANAPLMVMAAPNGARLAREGHPAVPLTTAELVSCAVQLLDAGVSVLHLHVRDRQAAHTLDTARYQEALDAIRAELGDALVLQVTTEAVGRYTPQQQMEVVRRLRPEAVSLALRELCPDEAALPAAAAFFADCVNMNCWAQYILYSAADVERFERYRKAGVFAQDRPSVLLVLGRYADGMAGHPEQLPALLQGLDTSHCHWAVCCFGALEGQVLQAAAGLGGHVRIGFENNQVLPDGRLATDNAELVTATLAHMPQRPLADSHWVRAQFRPDG
jgi:uncharacterized protein (DUF849 family)